MDADKPPLLLTHGFGASGRMWEPNVEALGAGRRVITWDMRGHGAADAPEDPAAYNHEACLDDMLALLDGEPRAVLCGMSLGGYLSLAFTLRHPERVAALVLVDTGPGFRDDAARDRWNATALELADRLEAEGMSALPASPEHTGAGHEHGAPALARVARGMLTQQDGSVLAGLGDVAVPTLIVVGSEDAPFLAAADVMERRIRGARKVVLEGAGHAANMDRPAEFNAAVRDFLEGL